jgi:hypothetical protein
MSTVSDLKRELRRRSEFHLRLAVLRKLGRGQPSTTEPYRPKGDWAWRFLFVPLYQRIGWRTKQRAMHAMGMTASGWQPPSRKPGEPWRPPPDLARRRAAGDGPGENQ